MHVLKEGAHSMAKEIAYDNETREKLATGVAKLADAVRVTIGPKGRYVGITKKGERHPNVSNDGATVAAHVGAYDHVEKMGLQVVREAATAANNEAGDGTSTATLLADAIVREEMEAANVGAWQYFAVVPDFRATGVREGKRAYDWPCIIRCINTVDVMTAEVPELDWALLKRITARITAEVPRICRVCYDLTPKPVGTVEWE